MIILVYIVLVTLEGKQGSIVDCPILHIFQLILSAMTTQQLIRV